jgi:predicted ATPase/Tol biopolymer transport system component/DNA-binding winged helix-turn-helix (wHTH) protein
MSLETKRLYEFGDFRLDLAEKVLLRDGESVPITPKVFETLRVFVEHAGRLIEKDELMQKLWQDRFVEESNLTFNVKMLRKALGDSASKPVFIETVPKRGYRFIAEVRSLELEEKDSPENFSASKIAKPETSIRQHFSVERHGNVIAVANWQSEPEEDASEDASAKNVPHLVSLAAVPRSLYGRSREIAAIENLLRGEDVRLVTLTGAGGTGKTVLAQTVADGCSAEFPDGVFFVELAAVANPDWVVSAIAQMLDVKETVGKSLLETLKTFLRERRTLLVLDNFEQIIPAAASLAELLESSLHLKILVTSRAALRLSAENELIVPPLAVPPTDAHEISADQLKKYSSVELFVVRARAVKSNFVLTDENAPAIAEICSKLDGLPLAIELAAARVKLLPPSALLKRLENRLKILTSQTKDFPARQQTMRETIAWSFDLLGEKEKTLFKRLAVFAGGFTLEAAEAVCGEETGDTEVLDWLESLEGSSLLQQTEEDDDGTRLLMLETIRQYSAEKLAENAAEDRIFRERQAEFFLTFAKQTARGLFGAKQATLLNQMEAERDNFRAALDWNRKTGGGNELKLAAALTPYWSFRGYLSEGIERLSAALERNPSAAPVVQAKALTSLGQLIWFGGDYVRAIAVCEESLALARQINYPMACARSLQTLGMSHWYQYGDGERANAYLEECLSLYRELRFDAGVVFTLVVFAAICQSKGDLARAEELLDEGLTAARRTNNNLALSIALVNYGRLEFAKGNFARAKQLCRESLRLREELADKWGLVQCLEPLAVVALEQGEPRRAAQMLGAIDVLLELLGAPPPLMFRADHERNLAAAHAALDKETFAESFAEGRKLRADEIVSFALDDSINSPRDSDFSKTDTYFSHSETDSQARETSSVKGIEKAFAASQTANASTNGFQTLAAPPPLAAKKGNNYFYPLAVLTLVVLLIFAVSFNSRFARSKSLEADAPVLSASFSSEKLSTNGKVVHAVVSPDGKNVVYMNGMRGKQSIWLRQLESANNVEIIPPSDDVYGRPAFSPDGNLLYFGRRPRNVKGQLDIYRVSIFGGVPTKIVNEAQGWTSISPDGGKISFVRCYYLEDENCSLWLADTDGGNERKLVSRPRPFRIGDNKISPDGKTVAFAVGQSKNAANEFGLVEVNIESGTERELSAQKFFDIKTLAWLPSQSGLLIAASRIPNKNFRLWQVSAATGDASPLTKDSESYSALSLDKAAGVIVTTQVKEDFKLFLHKRENPSEKRILADAATVGFAPNGKIIFSSPMSGNDEIWSINSDGGEQKQLTNDAADDSAPVSSPDNNSIFFVSNRTGKAQVWRMNHDGSSQAQITVKEGGYPIFVSPDGHWIYYHHGLQRTLWRVSSKGGEEEQLVLNKEKHRFAFSPDGSRVAFSEKKGEEKFIVIISLADGRTIKTFKYADQQSWMPILDWLPGLDWLPDGKSLAYVLADNEFDNHTLWLQPLDAETPQKIADLGDEGINSLAFSPDGESFAVVQGGWKHDAVLLKGLR